MVRTDPITLRQRRRDFILCLNCSLMWSVPVDSGKSLGHGDLMQGVEKSQAIDTSLTRISSCYYGLPEGSRTQMT